MTYKRLSRKMEVAVAGFCLLAAGCAVGPNYQTPDLPVPPTWIEAQQKGVQVRPAELTLWWTSFNDPILNSLVERAVRSNLDLRIAEARIREARGTRVLAAAGFWPTVNVSSAYSWNRASGNAIGSPTQNGGAVAAAPANANLEQNFYQTGFDASWEIDVFGGVRRSVEAADATLQATVEDRRDVLVSLLGEVAKNYIDLRGFQRQLDVTRANLKAQLETVDLTRVRFEAGLASDLEVAQSEAQANTTAALIPSLETSIKQAAYGLDVLLGSQPGSLWDDLAVERAIPTLPPEVLVELPAELLRQRPDIRRAERQLAAATAQVGVATADLYPKFSLIGNVGLQSISASDWFTGRSRYWSVGPTVTWPVFDAGRIRANIEIRSAQQEQALGVYEKTVLTAFHDVEVSLVAYAKEQERYRSLVTAVAANQRALTMANELYIRGLSDFLNVLDAQRALSLSENDLAQSQAAMASNLVSVYKAFGGGWQVP